MFLKDVYEKNAVIDREVKRNIVSLRESINLFDDLSDDPDDHAVAVQLEIETKKDIQAFGPAIIHKGFAYQINGDVYFAVELFPDYGKLSGRKLEEMEAGARVDVDKRKRNPFCQDT